MAETKTTTRGRKPKTVTPTVEANKEVTTNDVEKMMMQMQEQIQLLQKQLAESNQKNESVNKEKTDLQQLVEALQTNGSNDKQLPKKVKVMSLLHNKYNLITDVNGGKQFTFDEFGDVITMKTTELEEILSIQTQRQQAEQGYFYILDKDIVEDQELSDAYEHISDKEVLERVAILDSDECVDIFCNMDSNKQDSMATYMAERINDGFRLDRNRISDIAMRTDIDIEKIAENLKKSKR